MSKTYSSQDAAEFIGTTPRLLRRFIRQNDSWKNATHAGRYEFTQSEMESLKKQFDHWQNTRNRRSSTPREGGITFAGEDATLQYLDSDPGVTLEYFWKAQKSPTLKKELEAKRARRNSKLLERMKECGVSN